MNKYTTLLKNIGLFTVSNIALKLITFFLIPLYTSQLSTSEYGIVDMLNTVIFMVMPLATLSISDAVLRFCIEDKGNNKLYATAGFAIVTISCMIMILFLPLLDIDFFGGLGRYKGWFLLCYITLAFQTLFSNIARGVNKVAVMATASVLSSAVNIISVIVALQIFHYKISGVFLSVVLGNCAACLYYCLVGKIHHYFTFHCGGYKQILKKLLIYSLPLIPNSLSWWMTQNINRFFITGILGIGISGMYAAAAKIPSILSLLTSVFDQAWSLSAFQEFKHQNKVLFFRAIFTIYNAFLIVFVAVMIIFSRQISFLLLKNNFYHAWVLIPMLLIAFYYMALNSFWGSIYTSSMKTKYLFVTTLIGAVLCVLLTFIFVHSWGAIGACIASAVSSAITWMLRFINSRKIMQTFVNKTWLITSQAMVITLAIVNSFSLLSREPLYFFNAVALLVLILIQLQQTLPYSRILLSGRLKK